MKRTRAEHENPSKAIFEVQDKPRFQKRILNRRPSTTTRINKAKGSTPKPQERKGSRPYVEKPIYAKCGRKHEGKCLVGTGNCYSYGKSGHMKGDCPVMMAQSRENAQAKQELLIPMLLCSPL